MRESGTCRFCAAPLRLSFADLGMSPLCQTHIEPDSLNDMEPFYPLHARVCEQCWLVQLDEFVTPDDIFSDYAYFSSYSDSWVAHAQKYAAMAITRFGLGADSHVIEIASNDGYLLQHFVSAGIPCLGIEPAGNVAEVAVARGVPSEVCFFGAQSAADIARRYGSADLLVGNNVLAHVPDINDFVSGMVSLLAPGGCITMEFPHLMKLVEGNQFDTIYHEHFSYFSLTAVARIFTAHGLTVFDVDQLPTHGGSLRIYAAHRDGAPRLSSGVRALLQHEIEAGYERSDIYASFGERVRATKRALLSFLVEAKSGGKTIVGYGAPGKGNTLLNYCGIRTDFLDFTVDRSPHKYGRYTPGTHIPIFHPDAIHEARPDYVLILPWNLREEIMDKTEFIREWGGQFVVPIPTVTVYP